jgi:hypothetical protein
VQTLHRVRRNNYSRFDSGAGDTPKGRRRQGANRRRLVGRCVMQIYGADGAELRAPTSRKSTLTPLQSSGVLIANNRHRLASIAILRKRGRRGAGAWNPVRRHTYTWHHINAILSTTKQMSELHYSSPYELLKISLHFD